MTREELEARLAAKFPKVEKAKVQVKDYLTLRLPGPADLLPVVRWLKDEAGFAYLHMVTAVDWLGGLSLDGYVREPNFNVFLPEGATPEIDPPAKNAGVDYRESFEVVYAFLHLEDRLTLFLKVDVPRAKPHLPSLASLFPTADWQEREVLDLLGVEFDGHPNPRKILTPEFIQGHPLRKDYVHQKDRFDG